MVEDFEAKVEVLRKTFFPLPLKADLEDIKETIYPAPIDMPEVLDHAEVYKAIWKPKPDKATGIDGLPSRFLRAVTTEPGMLKAFSHLFQACVKLGYHPTEFKKANTVILKKQRKDDYSDPKAYRPIALLSTLGKALEAVVSNRLNICAEEHGLLPQEQMGARRGRSTETSLETIVEAVHMSDG